MITTNPSRFSVEQPLMGANPVFQAIDTATGKRVHLKCIEDRARVCRETRFLRKLRSPFVPAPLSLAREGNSYWLATEWIEGESIASRIPERRSWPTDLLRILIHMHRHGIMHGDLKPGNIIDRPNGTLVVVDLGFGQWIGEELPLDEAGGTPGFVAPERLSGWPADPRSDLYSLGRLLGTFKLLPEGHSLIQRLTAPSPANRPSEASALLPEFINTFGPGNIPPPDLAWANWRRGVVGITHLARGLMHYLGVDEFVARRLAAALKRYSGGARHRAAMLWERWLPTVCADPWCQTPESVWRAGMRSIDTVACDVLSAEIATLTPAARGLLGVLSHLAAPIEGLTEAGEELIGVPLPAWALDSVRPSGRVGLTELLERQVVVPARRHGPGAETLSIACYEHWWQALHLPAVPEPAELHQRAIRTLTKTSAADSANLEPIARANRAWHLERSEQLPEALKEYTTAARQSFERGNLRIGTIQFDQAVRILMGRDKPEATGFSEVTGNRSRKVHTLPSYEPPHALTIESYSLGLCTIGRTQEARRWLRWLYRNATEDQGKLIALRTLAEVALRGDAPKRVSRYLFGAQKMAGSNPRVWGSLHLLRAQELFALQKFEEADHVLARATACSRVADLEPRFHHSSRMLLGALKYRNSDITSAHAIWSIALRHAQDRQLRFSEAGAHLNLSATSRLLGDQCSAASHLVEAEASARVAGSWKHLWLSLSMAGEFALQREDWKMAVRCGELAYYEALDAGNSARAASAAARLARAMVRLGDLRNAERYLAEGHRLLQRLFLPADELDLWVNDFELALWFRNRLPDQSSWDLAHDVAHELNHRRTLAELAILGALRETIMTGSTERALEILGAPPEYSDLVGWHFLALARILRASGESSPARDAVARARQRFGESLLAGKFEDALCLLETSRIEVTEHSDQALADCSKVIHQARTMSSRWLESQALLLAAKIRTTLRSRTTTLQDPVQLPPGGDEVTLD